MDDANQNIAVIIGASGGLGNALVHKLLKTSEITHIYGTSRHPESLEATDRFTPLGMDLEDETSIKEAVQAIASEHPRIHLLINTAGLLHDGQTLPEKRLEDIDPERLLRNFKINAVGAALVFKHFHPLFRHPQRSVIATISARVGSIEDNELGGWYGYRASKAAQNQLTRTTAIEMRRKAPRCIVVALHPGTVNTKLSEPFHKNVPEGKLFEPSFSAQKLLEVIEGLGEGDSGKFYAWDKSPIPW